MCLCARTHLVKHYCFQQVYDRGFMVELRQRHQRIQESIIKAAGMMVVVVFYISSYTHHHVEMKCVLGIKVLQLT